MLGTLNTLQGHGASCQITIVVITLIFSIVLYSHCAIVPWTHGYYD